MLKFPSSVTGHTSRPSFKPNLENLEDRRLLAASLIGGNLYITQSKFNDSAVVTESSPILTTQLSTTPAPLRVVFPLSFINVQETINGVVQPLKSFNAAFVHRIIYHGGAGNDVFDNQTSVKCTAFGDAGDDKLSGGHNDDVLIGGIGNDELHGREGNDWLYGNDGNDVIRAGQGDDHLFGGRGYDDLFGALGNDYLDGGRDGIADKLTGGDGADTFVAERVRILFFTFNRDNPQDFDASQGDHII